MKQLFILTHFIEHLGEIVVGQVYIDDGAITAC